MQPPTISYELKGKTIFQLFAKAADCPALANKPDSFSHRQDTSNVSVMVRVNP